jgi:hypothetical protein
LALCGAMSNRARRMGQAAPLAMMWNTNPSTVIPTATAAIGSRCVYRKPHPL